MSVSYILPQAEPPKAPSFTLKKTSSSVTNTLAYFVNVLKQELKQVEQLMVFQYKGRFLALLINTSLKSLVRDKHSNLFCCNVIEKEKRFITFPTGDNFLRLEPTRGEHLASTNIELA
jgi:hypothetical protein